ncbi:hypothetical protein [Aeromonas tecta]|uniref:hypothetical protein n=1 Tax=Aeromonas tecta TaxID=324617 RepID=UPI000F9AC26D|nr:hypothetical protein [Aeromonas tecta]
MTQKAALLHLQEDSETFLARLGIDQGTLRRAVESGARVYLKATSFHPRTHGGVTAWGETVGILRQELSPFGWKQSDKNGLPVTANGGLGISIVVTSGDKETGIETGTPSSNNDKGSATKRFVNSNYDMFEDDKLSVFSSEPIDLHETWVLLYHYDKSKKEVRYELSLPMNLSASGYFDSWKKRYIFSAISLDEDTIIDPDNKTEFNDDIDFDISKKA